MFKLNITHTNTYAEVGQANPMRWMLMFNEEDGSLSSQSGLIACKDFFNDVVAWKKTQTAFKIYRFDNQVKFNEEGMYLLLSNIADTENFIANISAAINPTLWVDLGVEISAMKQEEDSVVILIPHEVWETTYYISVVSMTIRLCNYNVSYTNWESFFEKDSPLNTIEHAFHTTTKEYVREHGFALPKAFQEYWYYSSHGWNSANGKALLSSVVHDSGANAWVAAILYPGNVEEEDEGDDE
jgi:hypothetical protein